MILALKKLRIAVALVLLAVVSACSSGLSAEEYATRFERLVGVMADALVAADDLYHGEPTIGNIRSLVNGRAEARRAFLEWSGVLGVVVDRGDLAPNALSMGVAKLGYQLRWRVGGSTVQPTRASALHRHERSRQLRLAGHNMEFMVERTRQPRLSPSRSAG